MFFFCAFLIPSMWCFFSFLFGFSKCWYKEQRWGHSTSSWSMVWTRWLRRSFTRLLCLGFTKFARLKSTWKCDDALAACSKEKVTHWVATLPWINCWTVFYSAFLIRLDWRISRLRNRRGAIDRKVARHSQKWNSGHLAATKQPRVTRSPVFSKKNRSKWRNVSGSALATGPNASSSWLAILALARRLQRVSPNSEYRDCGLGSSAVPEVAGPPILFCFFFVGRWKVLLESSLRRRYLSSYATDRRIEENK